MIPEITIEARYRVTDSGTSDGTQIKYLYHDKWYKVDRYGGEGACEELASVILDLSDYDKEKYVNYEQILINGEPGCVSENFLKNDNEVFVSLYRLHQNILGLDPAIVTSKMDYDEAIDYIIDFVRKNTEIDITEYLADIFALDALILNEDRHFNNLGVIYDGNSFRTAPIFDNGKSLFIGNMRFDPNESIANNRKCAFAKAFSGSFVQNMRYLNKYISFVPNTEAIIRLLESRDLTADNIYSRLYQLII